MDDRTSPPAIPKGFVVITMSASANNGHLQVLRDKKTNAKDNECGKRDSFEKHFIVLFIK
jgi:hypothetical protein